MPYIYSNNGESVRWVEPPYTLREGERESDIYPDPNLMPPATSTPSTTTPSTNIPTTGTTTQTPPTIPTVDPLAGLRDKLTEYGSRIAALETRIPGTNP